MSVVPIIGEGEFEIDDEEVEREEFELDELLRNFVSEPPIQHDVLPESDEDNEEEEDPEAPQRMRTHIRRGDGICTETRHSSMVWLSKTESSIMLLGLAAISDNTGMIRISLVSNVLVMVRMMKLVAGKFMLRSFRRIKFGELGCL